jgi:hypothetical protein
MPYAASVIVEGPPEKSLAVVRDALVANAFTIAKVSKTGFTATGPGMNTNNQNTIRGVSMAEVHAEGNRLHISAELGAARRLGLFAILFPPGLRLILAAVFAVAGLNHRNAVYVPLFIAAPWLVLGPLLARMLRRRTAQAVDALLQSAASIARIK